MMSPYDDLARCYAVNDKEHDIESEEISLMMALGVADKDPEAAAELARRGGER